MSTGTSQSIGGAVKDRGALLDALLDLRARLLIPASKWNAQARAEALTVLDRAMEAT